MRLLAFSDLHGAHRRAAELVVAAKDADLVIGAGDFCNMRRGLDDALGLLAGIKAPLITVPGNAESAAELEAAKLPNMMVLHGQDTKVQGLHIVGIGGGIPVTPFGDWSFDVTEAAAETLLAPFETADILISHSPPKSVADITSAGASVGSVTVRDWVEKVQPRWVFCGHIHDSWGQSGHIGATQVYNLGPGPNWFEV